MCIQLSTKLVLTAVVNVIEFYIVWYRVCCRYNALIFSKTYHSRHPEARPYKTKPKYIHINIYLNQKESLCNSGTIQAVSWKLTMPIPVLCLCYYDYMTSCTNNTIGVSPGADESLLTSWYISLTAWLRVFGAFTLTQTSCIFLSGVKHSYFIFASFWLRVWDIPIESLKYYGYIAAAGVSILDKRPWWYLL